MTRVRTTAVLALLAGTGLVVLALGQGWEGLTWPLPGGLPLGNLLVALALCAPAVAAQLLSAPGTAGRRLALGALVAGAAWLPVSVLLAGNLNLNNFGDRYSTWVIFTAITAVLVLGALGWAFARLAWRRFAEARAVNHQQ